MTTLVAPLPGTLRMWLMFHLPPIEELLKVIVSTDTPCYSLLWEYAANFFLGYLQTVRSACAFCIAPEKYMCEMISWTLNGTISDEYFGDSRKFVAEMTHLITYFYMEIIFSLVIA
jgi:hypothetical protein